MPGIPPSIDTIVYSSRKPEHLVPVSDRVFVTDTYSITDKMQGPESQVGIEPVYTTTSETPFYTPIEEPTFKLGALNRPELPLDKLMALYDQPADCCGGHYHES